MIERQAIVDEARRWLGTKWKHQASLRGVGADCIGFVAGVAMAVGVAEATAWRDNPASHQYGRQPDALALLEACAIYLEPAPVEGAQLGDVLVMRFTIEPQHFALVSALDPTYIIHAYAQARRVVEHRLDSKWSARVVRAYRFRGVG
jgi:NlpC/P60 family putative phage cell wall peptidase